MTEQTGLRIGIYGGAFDPVHYTHLSVAQAVTTHLALDRLIWVPTGMAWHKLSQLSDAEHRVRMLELAFEDFDVTVRDKWSISPLEIERSKPSYSVETVLELQADLTLAGAQWFLAIGTDQFNLLHSWKDWPILLQQVSLAVIARADVPMQVKPEVLAKAHWEMVPMQTSALSSSLVRNMLKDLYQMGDGRQAQIQSRLSEYVPPKVAAYIIQQGLYR